MSRAVSDQSSSAGAPGSAASRPLWIAVAVLLGIGAVPPLLVMIYDRETPALGGFPFFFWFQFALIPVTAVATYAAFKLSQTATARDRVARGLPAHPEGGEQ